MIMIMIMMGMVCTQKQDEDKEEGGGVKENVVWSNVISVICVAVFARAANSLRFNHLEKERERDDGGGKTR